MFSVSDKHQSEEVVQEFKDKAEPGPKPGMIYSYLGSTLDLACSPAAHHWDFFSSCGSWPAAGVHYGLLNTAYNAGMKS